MEHLVGVAFRLAETAHHGQKRKSLDVDYITHPVRVAAAAKALGMSEEAQAAALLHDVVEDTKVSLADLGHEGMPPRVLDLVEVLTKRWHDDTPTPIKAQLKVAYYARIVKDPDALLLKILDRCDNLDDMLLVVGTKRRWAQKYLEKTTNEFSVLTTALYHPQLIARFAYATERLRRALLDSEEVESPRTGAVS